MSASLYSSSNDIVLEESVLDFMCWSVCLMIVNDFKPRISCLIPLSSSNSVPVNIVTTSPVDLSTLVGK